MKESCANSNLATQMSCKLDINMKFLQEILIRFLGACTKQEQQLETITDL